MRWVIFVILLSITACAPVLEDAREGRETARSEVVGDVAGGLISPVNMPVIGVFKGEPFILRYNAKGELVYKRSGEEQVVSDESPLKSNLSHIVSHTDENGIYVLWRPKLVADVAGVGQAGDKLIYFRASYDGRRFGKTLRLNNAGGAFQPKVAGNGRGSLYVVWVDERNGAGKYDLYMNVSHDSGRTWKEKDIRVDIGEAASSVSLDPSIVAEGNSVWLSWNEVMDGSPNLYLRRSEDRGETWGQPVLISKEVESPTGITLIKKGNSLLLYWFNFKEVRLAHSEDGGFSWEKLKLEGIDAPAELKVLSTGDKVYLIIGVLPDGGKEDLFLAVSDDGINFRKPKRLDTNTPYRFTSTGPDGAVDDAGNILVAWHDFRNFRSNIYFNFSGDKGQTWLKSDQRLSGAEGVRHFYYPRVAADGKGGFYILWVGYSDERFERARLYLSRVNPKDGFNYTEKRPDEGRLRERVSMFWKDRMAANWGGNYDLLDPYTRDKYSREFYVASQFRTIYHGFEIKDIKITEGLASVTIKYTVEVPEFVSPSGKKLKVPKRDEEITEDWIWIDGDWFRVFKDIRGGAFVRY
jgi:hypothetical protein